LSEKDEAAERGRGRGGREEGGRGRERRREETRWMRRWLLLLLLLPWDGIEWLGLSFDFSTDLMDWREEGCGWQGPQRATNNERREENSLFLAKYPDQTSR